MRVFVTGMGAITSLGNSVESFFNGLVENQSGIKYFPEWENYVGLQTYVGGPVGDYNTSLLPRTVRRSMSRMSEMAVLATFQALEHAKFTDLKKLQSSRTLLILGSTSGSPFALETYFRKIFEKNGPQGQLSTSFFKIMNHSVAANVAAALEFNGSLLSPSSACATSTQAMILGWEMIKSGLYDVVIAGGADELHFLSAAIFDIVQAASRKYKTQPESSSRPFDQARDGLVVSEGAGIVVLESEAFAKARNATSIAEIRGGSYICDGSHMTQSSSSVMAQTMRYAIQRSDITQNEINYINAHATGTIQGDIEEARAIEEIFGDSVPVSSLKGHMGHSLAACGALEAIASIKMMEHDVLIPTKNLVIIDEECRGINLLQKIQNGRVKTFMSNNFAFGGMNTSILFSKV
jgi:3-oxoacyl-[acyl-carrier-protein] synthase II